MTARSTGDERVPRPRLALRIGVTGARDLGAAARDPAQIEAEVNEVLRSARTIVGEARQQARARDTYRDAAELPPLLRLLSPLAPGADALVARLALAQGASLYVPMPFARPDYEGTWKDERDSIATLLHDAEERGTLEGIIELDGLPGAQEQSAAGEDPPMLVGVSVEDASYEAVGRLVVRQSDIVIALWNGKPAKGRGGTGDIVRYAAARRVPVIWIHTEANRPPQWIGDLLDLNAPVRDPAEWRGVLAAYLGDLFILSRPDERRSHSGLDRMAAALRGWLGMSDDPLARLLSEKLSSWFAFLEIYAPFMRLLTGSASPHPGAQRPSDDQSAFWFDRGQVLDRWASAYASRYRSAVLWVFLIAAAALVSAAVSLAAKGPAVLGHGGHLAGRIAEGAALVELALLSLVLAVVLIVKARDWHERSIEYRILAELCRKQQVLAPLGWGLSVEMVRRTLSEPAAAMVDTDGPGSERGQWVPWLLAAWQREAPMVTGRLVGPQLAAAADAVRHLVDDQIRYHDVRHRRSHKASGKLEAYGFGFFVAVLVLVLIKLAIGAGEALFEHDLPESWQTRLWYASLTCAALATVLPGVSAAFVGIRSFSEFELLSAQSLHMRAQLRAARVRIRRIMGDGGTTSSAAGWRARPLASQMLGVEAADVTSLMMQDLEGWTRLFRVKVAEVG